MAYWLLGINSDDFVIIHRGILTRLRQVETISAKMVKLLDDGKVDYPMIEELKKVLSG